jgi:hypothetical protein
MVQNNNMTGTNTILHQKTVMTAGVQSLPLGVPDDRLKLRVTIDQKFRDNIRRSQGISVCQSQLTPPAKVPSSPTCSSPERGSEQDSLYDSGYCKQYSRVQDWGQFQSYQDRYYQQGYTTQVGQMYATNTSVSARSQERILLVKNEPQVQVLAVKTEPKPEPADTYSLADLDGITDLLPIQTDFRVDAASLSDLDFWDKGGERSEERYVVTSRPGQLEARWEQPHKFGERWTMSNVHTESKAEKWESGSAASSNSSHFDFSSNADEVFSQIGLRDAVSAAEFITL